MKPGMIIQIDPAFGSEWAGGQLAVVEEVTLWGIVGDVLAVDQQGRRCVASVRVPWESLALVGDLEWLPVQLHAARAEAEGVSVDGMGD